MEFGLLGPLTVVDGSEVLTLGGRRQRTVLAHLILRANRAVTQELLIDLVWGDDPPATARGSLQAYVSRLRGILGQDRIQGRGGRYVLTAAPDEVDTMRFVSLVEEAQRVVVGDPSSASRAYCEALGLWRGPALEDLRDEPSLRPETVRLDELRLRTTEDWLATELALGRHERVLHQLETLVGQQPYREQLWGHLMVALYRSGRQRDALDVYQRVRERLADELGLDPWPELQRLRDQVISQDPALDLVGQPLRGYRLLERVGEGAFGTVHRAFQPEMGREVAVKVIRPELANDPEFIRRFGAEAELSARLEHPYVVPLHDYWREPGGAYLVMRYLRGGSLRDVLAQGPLEPDRVSHLIEQVALALEFAHRQGVVHRDVKPANILFDEDGNAYLSDFRLAKELGSSQWGEVDALPSPLAAYLSPEEARGEPVGFRADIYSLGVVAFEALAGRHPFADVPAESLVDKHAREPLPPLRAWRADLPGAVELVIAGATAKRPTDRPADAVAFSTALRDALAPLLGQSREQVDRAPVRNPYKGLRPFLEADAGDFHGRQRVVGDLVRRMSADSASARFVAVVGASGSGKSSLVRAGLVPALRQGAIPGSEGWFVVEMHPGTHPFEELAAALTRISAIPLPGLVNQLQQDDDGLIRATDSVLPNRDAQFLLVIDQFEEIFTLLQDEDQRAAFLCLLATAVTDPGSRVRVVVTLRADFYDLPLSHPGIAELTAAGTFSVTPLTSGELERAVNGPAEAVGVTVAPALVAALVADVEGQSASLPLLQYALTEMFEQRDGQRLTLAAYDAVGGVSGALARRAEDLYGRLTAPGQEAARQLFLRLVTVGEAGAADTRRRVTRAELGSLGMDPEAMEAAVAAFGARRLLTFDRDPVTRGPTVEVAHEALLRTWTRLRGWIEAASDDVAAHRRLASATREWIDSGRDDSVLLRGDRLRRLETWTGTSGLALTADERTFLDASITRREAEHAAEEARAARERALERRSLVRLRAAVAVVSVFAVLATALGLVALDQRQKARTEARVAQARELAAAAIANLDQDPELSTLLALEAVGITRGGEQMPLREVEEALHRAVESLRIVRTLPAGGFGLALSSEGRRVVTVSRAGEVGEVVVWDIESGRHLVRLTRDHGATTVALSPDDRLVATAHMDGTVHVWDATSGTKRRVLRGVEGFVGQPVFSPDGRWLAAGGADGAVRIWEVASGRTLKSLEGHDGQVVGTAFSPDGSRLATAGLDTTVRVWELRTDAVVATLEGHAGPVLSVTFTPDGGRVVSASLDAEARLWDVASGSLLRTFAGPAPVQAAAVDPAGTRLVTAGADAVARVWDVATARELVRLAGHGGGFIGNVVFTPDGRRVITSGLDDTTRVWDVDASGAGNWLTVDAVEQPVAGVTFSPDGSTFAAPAGPGGVTVWDVATGAEVITLTGHEDTLSILAYSPDGTRLVAGSEASGALAVWDVRSGALLPLDGHPGLVRGVVFSPDGDRILSAGAEGVWVWDAVTGAEVTRLERTTVDSYAVAYSADGRLLATGHDQEVRLWDGTTFALLRILRGHSATVTDVAFDATGSVVSTAEDGTAHVWDLAEGRVSATFRGHRGPVNQVAVALDGTRVATTADDGTVRVWDPSTGRELLTLVGHRSAVFGVDFSSDGRMLASASHDGTVALHLLSMDELAELARDRVTRELTEQECRDYLHVTSCP